MYSSDPERRQIRLRPGLHRLDESATGYSSASWSPPLLASASPAVVMLKPVAGTVNHHSFRAGEFSAGEMGNFQVALTNKQSEPCEQQKSDRAQQAAAS